MGTILGLILLWVVFLYGRHIWRMVRRHQVGDEHTRAVRKPTYGEYVDYEEVSDNESEERDSKKGAG